MKTFPLTIKGYYTELPILPLPSGISIAFFNLHGNPSLTEHCAKELCKELTDCDVIITAESKGLQLAHCVARELGHEFYAVARKSKKLYMQDGIVPNGEFDIYGYNFADVKDLGDGWYLGKLVD